MEIIKKFRIVFLIILPLLILILFNSIGSNHFKPDTKKWAGPSETRVNIVKTDQLASLPGEILLINLDDELLNVYEKINLHQVNIVPDSILLKKNLTLIRKNPGPVLLFASQPGKSARIWMIISQLGIENIYILTSDSDNEVLKFKFRRDSLLTPEF